MKFPTGQREWLMSNQKSLIWDQTFPLIRLEGEGTKAFLQGQTTTDFNNLCNQEIVQSCWLDSSARVKALLEISFKKLILD